MADESEVTSSRDFAAEFDALLMLPYNPETVRRRREWERDGAVTMWLAVEGVPVTGRWPAVPAPYPTDCASCGCPKMYHEHAHRGRYCGTCGCKRYARPSAVVLAIRSISHWLHR